MMLSETDNNTKLSKSVTQAQLWLTSFSYITDAEAKVHYDIGIKNHQPHSWQIEAYIMKLITEANR